MKLIQSPFVDLLAALRAPAPTPGGGSASAMAAAMGASLLAMVGSMPKHRAASEEDVDRLQAAARRCEELSERLAELVDVDSEAYDLVVDAYRLPKSTDAEKTERNGRIQQAMRAAVAAPLEVMQRSAETIEAAAVVAAFGNPNAASDVGVALELLGAAERGARLNVEINLKSIRDADDVARIRKRVEMLDAECVTGINAARRRLAEST